MSPFFSVCMPLHNRADTIERALESLAKQTFRDFQVMIVDCGSTDDTRERVVSFFENDTYRHAPFPYRFETQSYIPKGTEDWNEPVRLATGTYIAILEGDDYFLRGHLARAYEILSRESGIGIYATGNQRTKRDRSGRIPATEHLRKMYRLDPVPPPSETIFRRFDQKGKPFLYDDNYAYAPEIDLYIRIDLAGFDAYYDVTQNVWRRIIPKRKAAWRYFADHYRIGEVYARASGITVSDRLVSRSIARKRAYSAYGRYCGSEFDDDCAQLRTELFKRDSWRFYLYFAVVQARARFYALSQSLRTISARS